ncbi:MAG: hypothetical protein ABI416_11650 [Ginsengibacter sp.]
MRKSFLVSGLPMIFLFSCAVLSDSQRKNINTFATVAKNYTNFPGAAVKKSQQLHYNNDVLEASAIPDSTQIIRSLTKAKTEFEKGIVFSNKMNLSLKLIQKYAALLAQLSSDSYVDELGKNARELSGELNNAVDLFNAQLSTKIPDKVGKGISQIITIIGGRIIQNKQSKALKMFIPIADTLIQLTTVNLVSALDGDLKPLIESYKETFQSDFKAIIFDHADKVDYNMLRFYIKSNEDFADVESFRKRCIRAAENMAASHNELKDNIARKKTLTELLVNTKAFIADVKELYAIVNKFSND